MTKEKIIKIIDEKINNGVIVTSVKGNVEPDSDLGYKWEYYVDVRDEPILDEDGYETGETEEEFVLCFYHCGNGRGCFGVVDEYDCLDERQANEEMVEAAKNAAEGDVIEFSDGTVLYC